MELFEQASRLQLRFDTPNGQLTTEDLWGLPLTSPRARQANLDDIAKELYGKLKSSSDVVSFVTPVAANPNAALQVAFDVVKHVIAVRIAERDAAAEAATRREKKQQLLSIIAGKEIEQLQGKSIEELRAAVEAM